MIILSFVKWLKHILMQIIYIFQNIKTSSAVTLASNSADVVLNNANKVDETTHAESLEKAANGKNSSESGSHTKDSKNTPIKQKSKKERRKDSPSEQTIEKKIKNSSEMKTPRSEKTILRKAVEYKKKDENNSDEQTKVEEREHFQLFLLDGYYSLYVQVYKFVIVIHKIYLTVFLLSLLILFISNYLNLGKNLLIFFSLYT